MKRIVQEHERRNPADRRKGAVGFWRVELERRGGSLRRKSALERHPEAGKRRHRGRTLSPSQRRNRLLGKSSEKWFDISLVLEATSLLSPQTMRRVRLCGMVELGRCGQEKDMGIYVDNILAGAITYNDKWHVWRLIEACEVNCASELRMYMDRLCRIASFQSLREARGFVKGPFKRYVLAEVRAARKIKAG